MRVVCGGSVSAAPASLPAALDQARIHSYYTDGEFDKVIKDLEAFSKSRRACTHAESVFVEKHLSVVYAAHPGTRELGRYHMYRLLDLSPGSDLLDMFVGEEVGGVFEKVGKEYALRNPAKAAANNTAKAAAKTAAPSGAHAGPNPKPRSAPSSSPVAPAASVAKGAASADKRIQALVNARPPLPAAETRPAADKRAASPAAGPAKPAASSGSPARPAPVSYRLPVQRPPPSGDKRAQSRDSAVVSKRTSRPTRLEGARALDRRRSGLRGGCVHDFLLGLGRRARG